MSAYQYELLKCEGCGKTLGYIYVEAKIGFSGVVATRYWFLQGRPTSAIEKTAFCENCFQERLDDISKGKLEPKAEKDKGTEPRDKSKGRPLVR